MNRHWLGAFAGGIALMIASTPGALAQSSETLSFGPGRPVPAGDPVKGQHVFDAICGGCHSHDLSGGKAPSLTGPTFYAVWQGKSVDALFDFVRNSMPKDNPGELSDTMARDVVAYIVTYANRPAEPAKDQAAK